MIEFSSFVKLLLHYLYLFQWLVFIYFFIVIVIIKDKTEFLIADHTYQNPKEVRRYNFKLRWKKYKVNKSADLN